MNKAWRRANIWHEEGFLPNGTSSTMNIYMSGSYNPGFPLETRGEYSALNVARNSRWFKTGSDNAPSDGKGDNGETGFGCQFGGVPYARGDPRSGAEGGTGAPYSEAGLSKMADQGLCNGRDHCHWTGLVQPWLIGVREKAWENCTEFDNPDHCTMYWDPAWGDCSATLKRTCPNYNNGLGECMAQCNQCIAQACYETYQSSPINQYGLTGRNMDKENLDAFGPNPYNVALANGSTITVPGDKDWARKMWNLKASKIYQLADTDRIVVESITLALDPGDPADPTLKSLYMIRCPSGDCPVEISGQDLNPPKEENMVTYEDLMSNPKNYDPPPYQVGQEVWKLEDAVKTPLTGGTGGNLALYTWSAASKYASGKKYPFPINFDLGAKAWAYQYHAKFTFIFNTDITKPDSTVNALKSSTMKKFWFNNVELKGKVVNRDTGQEVIETPVWSFNAATGREERNDKDIIINNDRDPSQHCSGANCYPKIHQPKPLVNDTTFRRMPREGCTMVNGVCIGNDGLPAPAPAPYTAFQYRPPYDKDGVVVPTPAPTP
jgi:hypothetical protein